MHRCGRREGETAVWKEGGRLSGRGAGCLGGERDGAGVDSSEPAVGW